MLIQIDVLAIVGEILEVPASSIAVDADLEELGWDSLSDLSFIAIADERYHRDVNAQQLIACRTPSDLGLLLA